jgi:uncharacterized membrane protein SpoIIM required for sporulation
MVDHVNTGFSLAKAIIWAIILFIVSAIIEGIITARIIRMYGCPMNKKH